MISTLLSIVSGGATGLLGSVLSRLFDLLTVREKNKFEIKRLEAEREYLKMEIDRDVVVAKTEATARMEVAASEAFAKSFEADRAAYIPKGVKLGKVSTFMLVVVDCVRGSIRPLMTVYLCALTTCIYFQLVKELNIIDQMTAIQIIKIVDKIVNTLLYLTITAVTWWYGSRPKKDK